METLPLFSHCEQLQIYQTQIKGFDDNNKKTWKSNILMIKPDLPQIHGDLIVVDNLFDSLLFGSYMLNIHC